ncbi:energy-coupling factor ABC transporter ATP-binding protein [Agathobacter ruminis]|uniref:Cobalt ABC transporter n=1 Tax=Agathobacter ruminis TaxID=1712665 RepID=A0A2G3E1Q4_9FIRM|nr:ABC transporter ATP-binding protein [Agathobacter ruminis]MDC7301602.1 energy-coupling factor ABC transporter ATP-binding protein [Agathobacter ruminis]PHU37080.1 cobalt ABC transporter [Agathobacter ruminis]
MSLLELKQIEFSYEKDETAVLSDFSLAIEAGQCVLVLGENGAGKSTLFRILNGLSFAQSGTYHFDGILIDERYLKNNRNAKQFHKRIGYLFQNPDVMLFNATVYDEIAFGPRQMGLSDEEVDRRVLDSLSLMEIESLRQKAPYHLSGGQKKKVALAAVLSLNPDVLILDEPFAGLDKKSEQWLLQLLKDLKAAGKTLVIATHADEKFQEIADTSIIMGEKGTRESI